MRVMRAVGWAVGILIVLGALGWFWRWHIAYGAVMPMMLAPAGEVEGTAFAVLDFSDESNWAALPWRGGDPSDRNPEGAEGDAGEGAADVFYIHPTTYLSSAAWNVPRDEMRNTPLLEDIVLRDQPNAFNACCRVFAPYYQQATFYAFVDRGPNGLAALDRAYEDVRAAFRHYLTEWRDGRPLIIAAHSQGSLHAQRLMQEEIIGTPLEDHLVVAYVPGYRLPDTPPLPVCRTGDETGCLLTWNNVTAPYWLPPFMYDLPLASDAGYSRNVAGSFVCAPPAPDGEGYTGYHAGDRELMPAVGSVVCTDGLLHLGASLEPALAAFPMSRGWWHVYEYAHFWVAIGADAQRRLDAHDANQGCF